MELFSVVQKVGPELTVEIKSKEVFRKTFRKCSSSVGQASSGGGGVSFGEAR